MQITSNQVQIAPTKDINTQFIEGGKLPVTLELRNVKSTGSVLANHLSQPAELEQKNLILREIPVRRDNVLSTTNPSASKGIMPAPLPSYDALPKNQALMSDGIAGALKQVAKHYSLLTQDNLGPKLTALSDGIKQYNKVQQSLDQKLDTLKQLQNNWEVPSDKVQQQIAHVRQAISQLSQELTQLTQGVNEQLTLLTSQRQALDREGQKLDEEKKNTENNILFAKGLVNQGVAQQKEKAASVTEQLESAQAKKITLQNQLKADQDKLKTDYQTKRDSYTQKFADSKMNVANNKDSLENAKADLAKAKKTFDKFGMINFGSTKQQALEQVKQCEQKVSQFEKFDSIYTQELKQIDQELATLEKKLITDLKAVDTSAKAHMAKIEAKLTKLGQERDQLRLNEQHIAKTDFTQPLKSDDKYIEGNKEQKAWAFILQDGLTHQQIAMQAQLDSLNAQIATLDTIDKAEQSEERSTLRQAVSSLRSEVSQLGNEARNATTDDLIWLHHVRQQAGENPTLTAKMLAYPMQFGLCPSNGRVAQALLKTFYPLPLDDKQAAQRAHEDTEHFTQWIHENQAQQTAISAFENTWNKQRSIENQRTQTTTYLTMLAEASQLAEKAIVAQQKALQQDGTTYQTTAHQQQITITSLNLFYTSARADIEKSGKTDQLFAALDKQSGPVSQSVRQCIASKAALDNQALPGKQDKRFDLFYWGGKRETDFLKQFDKDRPAHLALLTERSAKLATYAQQLTQLSNRLPDGDTQHDTLQKVLGEVEKERDTIDSFLRADNAFAMHRERGEELEKTLISQKDKTQTFEKQRDAANVSFKQQLAQCNQERYMQYASVLRHKNLDIRTLVQSRNTLTQELVAYEKSFVTVHFETELEKILDKSLDKASDKERTQALSTLVKGANLTQVVGDKKQILETYNQLINDKVALEEKLEDLNDRFRLNLLQLQQEEQLAKKGEGYPDNYNWGDWAKQRAGESLFGDVRPQPFQLVLEHQLAMQGLESMTEAYKALGKAALGGDIGALGVTPGSLHAWAKAHPWEARELASNLQHTYNIMTSDKATNFGGAVIDMVKQGWDRGTAENIAKDMLMGTRDELAGVTELTPMPAAMIALLDLAGWAPHIANSARAAQGDNLAGKIGGLFGKTLDGVPFLGTAVNVALGIVQTKIEKEIAGVVVEHRDFEVAANAVFKGMAAAGSDPLKFCKEVAGYTLKRQALQEAGTIHLDIKEVGKTGTVARFREEMGLWWKHSTTLGKVRLVAAAVVAPAAIGSLAVAAALAAVGTGGGGLILAALFGLLGAGSGSLLTRNMWNFLAGPFGLGDVRNEVRNEMNSKRLQNAVGNVREKLLRRARKDQEELKSVPGQGIGKLSADEVTQLRVDAKNVVTKVIDKALGYQNGEVVLNSVLMQALTEKYGNLADLQGADLEKALEYVSDQLEQQIKDTAISEGQTLANLREQANKSLIDMTVAQSNAYITDLSNKHTMAQQRIQATHVDEKKTEQAVRSDVANTLGEINNQVLEQMKGVLGEQAVLWGKTLSTR